MSASSTTLIQTPSFALNDTLLPSRTLTKHECHFHLKQNLTTTTLFVAHSRGFRVHSTKGKTPTPATATAITTTAERLSLAAYLKETLGLSESEALTASRKLLRQGYKKKQSNVNTFLTIKKTGDAISYLQNESGLDISLSHIKTLVAKYPKILGAGADLKKTCTPFITLLQNEFGFSKDRVLEFLLKYPRAFLLDTDMLKDRLVTIEHKWSISRETALFFTAITLFCSVNDDKIESRCQVYRSFGWSDSDILTLVRTNPYCIGYSEARIRKSLEFYMNELGYEPAYLAARPLFQTSSLETKVKPRHKVLLLLKENLFVKPSHKLYSCLMMTDDKFEEKFILPYEKLLPEIRQVYNEGRTPNN